MRLGWKISLVAVLLFPAWLYLRGWMIRQEGPQVVRALEKYRSARQVYPESLRQAGVRSFWHPLYFYDRKNNRYTLMYSLFVFYRWYYSSQLKAWKYLD